jgi:hypothetical protein
LEEAGYETRKVDGVTIIYDPADPKFVDTVEESVRFMEEALNIDVSGGLQITNLKPIMVEIMRERIAELRQKTVDDPNTPEQVKEFFDGATDLEVYERIHTNNLGAYTDSEGIIFMQTENLPKPGSKGFSNTLWHEIAHRIDAIDTRNWRPPFAREHHGFRRIRGISQKYMDRIGYAYGYGQKLRNEYFADLVEAWLGSQKYQKPPQFSSRVGHRKLDPVEIEDMHHLIAYLEEEVSPEFPLTDRAGERPVLVSFAVPDGTREVLEVDQSELDDLPESAIRLDRPEAVVQILGSEEA